MIIAEHLDDDGRSIRTRLTIEDDGARVVTDGEPPVTLPVRAVLVTMRRYGRALDPDITPAGERLALGDGLEVCELLFKAGVDVEPRSYLVLVGDGEPLAALATEVAAALRYLGRKQR